MGLQKYRADKAGKTGSNGATPWYANWVGGPSLALIRDCPCENDPDWIPRTVYITGEPDTWFTQPAVARIKGKIVRGYVTNAKPKPGDGVHAASDFTFVRRYPWLTQRALERLSENATRYEASAASYAAHGGSNAPLELVGHYAERFDYFTARAQRCRAAIEALKLRAAKRLTARIRVSYEVVTPESAEHGDAAERGWKDKRGSVYTLDEAVKLMGCVEPSNSHFQAGTWYTDADGDTDYRTGAETRCSYHVEASLLFQEQLFKAVTK